jgi:hypothetical protein
MLDTGPVYSPSPGSVVGWNVRTAGPLKLKDRYIRTSANGTPLKVLIVTLLLDNPINSLTSSGTVKDADKTGPNDGAPIGPPNMSPTTSTTAAAS